ncbi:DUF4352 domain-containing protein [Romboutsia ilealis]|uniref:DUF4352 domain-containing protein n=1 Tax=Romboutsia faecis TaxID=2764597 RepID=A0ABR7JKJ2_9FIRM|nr:DUF4352 domain-containing protein [Romboutsia faecis]MBC5995272.1 DUF4352 domain-containing protein [Romboutsia faecis]MRN24482.1 DUF4352 domain-containing protein [Romboutsia ilealis]
MYKKYKLDGPGNPKYDPDEYRIAHERRFSENTEEWNRILQGDTRFRRRHPQNKSNSIKVKDILIIITTLFIILSIGLSKFNKDYSIPNTNINPINITINNITTGIEDQYAKASSGNKLVYIDVSLENSSNNPYNIDLSKFKLIDKNSNTYNLLHYTVYNENSLTNINPNSSTNIKLVFELPLEYSDEVRLSIN